MINAISPNILCYKAVKDVVFHVSGTPNPRAKHSKVDIKIDVFCLLEIFTSSRLFKYSTNRVGFSSDTEF